MLHDEMVYPDPFAFRPERWKDITRADFDKHPQNVVYGYGRRFVSMPSHGPLIDCNT